MGAIRPTQALLFRVSPLAQLKLLALPLTTPKRVADTPPAFLLHAKRTPPAKIDLKNEDGSKKDLPYVTRATVWAADQWAKLGQADENTWKRKAFVSSKCRICCWPETSKGVVAQSSSARSCMGRSMHYPLNAC